MKTSKRWNELKWTQLSSKETSQLGKRVITTPYTHHVMIPAPKTESQEPYIPQMKTCAANVDDVSRYLAIPKGNKDISRLALECFTTDQIFLNALRNPTPSDLVKALTLCIRQRHNFITKCSNENGNIIDLEAKIHSLKNELDEYKLQVQQEIQEAEKSLKCDFSQLAKASKHSIHQLQSISKANSENIQKKEEYSAAMKRQMKENQLLTRENEDLSKQLRERKKEIEELQEQLVDFDKDRMGQLVLVSKAMEKKTKLMNQHEISLRKEMQQLVKKNDQLKEQLREKMVLECDIDKLTARVTHLQNQRNDLSLEKEQLIKHMTQIEDLRRVHPPLLDEKPPFTSTVQTQMQHLARKLQKITIDLPEG